MTTVGCGNYEGVLSNINALVNLNASGAPVTCGSIAYGPFFFISASVDVAAQLASITITVLGPQNAINGASNYNRFSGTKSVDLSGGCPADISGSYTLTPDVPWLTFPGCGNPAEQLMVVTIS
jgi:hypothetical protein